MTASCSKYCYGDAREQDLIGDSPSDSSVRSSERRALKARTHSNVTIVQNASVCASSIGMWLCAQSKVR